MEISIVERKGKTKTMDQIREKYGSDVISKAEAKKLTA